MKNVKRTWQQGQRRVPVAQGAGQVERRRPLGKQRKIAQDDDPGRKLYLANRIHQVQADLRTHPGGFADRDRNRWR